MAIYLVCHVDGGLSAIPTEMPNHLDFAPICRDGRDYEEMNRRGKEIQDTLRCPVGMLIGE